MAATAWDRLLKVTIPMMSPVIFFTMIMTVIGSFQIFTAAFIMTEGGPADATLFFILYLYSSAFQWLRIGFRLGDGLDPFPDYLGADAGSTQPLEALGVLRRRGADLR